MNDLALAILSVDDRLTIASLYGSAGAGGVMLALAADKVFARDGIVLNPHYKGMGGLYGSEYWTYSLPKRVGAENALELTGRCLPVGVREARAIGLIDDVILRDEVGEDAFGGFREQIARIADGLARSPRYAHLLQNKRAVRERDERVKPLRQYRVDELAEMTRNFWGDDRRYHEARAAFVRKRPRAGELKWPAGPARSPSDRVHSGWAGSEAGRQAA
jgi:putative two-component system hydrogenase maturation factor HypX/HoxX